MRQAELKACEGVMSGNPGGERQLFPGNADAEAASCYYRQIITGGGEAGGGGVLRNTCCCLLGLGAPSGLDCRPKNRCSCPSRVVVLAGSIRVHSCPPPSPPADPNGSMTAESP